LSTCAASEGALMLYDGGANTSAMRVFYIAQAGLDRVALCSRRDRLTTLWGRASSCRS